MRIVAFMHTTAGNEAKLEEFIDNWKILFQTQVGELIGDNDLYVLTLSHIALFVLIISTYILSSTLFYLWERLQVYC